ncbi:hypothetical protein JAAARDRAFT_59698 [Jaapia argillacea MUCL 33604]|uniref:Hcy-binding domain-containing protein n=1 Tax=Jaapia argillacea MUCL 33604 TaxID=933084 RepID=A0A067PLM7_9AGAM|nr:hypothetical protein JAAARDRAFT_59698 [Jaapia argillacea MUCL 33604]
MDQLFGPKKLVILDGGFGTTLEDVFHYDISHTPLWSARPIDLDPEVIINTHLAFLRTGARVILTSTYQCAFSTFERAGYTLTDAKRIMRKSVLLAQEARTRFLQERSDITSEDIKIALSLGPFGATLSPAQEFDGFYPPPYGPQGFVPDSGENRNAFNHLEQGGEGEAIDALAIFHEERLKVFLEDDEVWSKVDCVAFETVPLRREISAIRKAMAAVALNAKDGMKPWWISTVFPDGNFPAEKTPGGDRFSIQEVIQNVFQAGADEDGAIPDGFGINCTSLEFLASLIAEAEAALARISLSKRPWLVLYPNGGDTYDPASQTWNRQREVKGVTWAHDLVRIVNSGSQRDVWGGRIVGGCCRTGPAEIEALVRGFEFGL